MTCNEENERGKFGKEKKNGASNKFILVRL